MVVHSNWSINVLFDREDSLGNELFPSDTVMECSSLVKSLHNRIEIAEAVYLLGSGYRCSLFAGVFTEFCHIISWLSRVSC